MNVLDVLDVFDVFDVLGAQPVSQLASRRCRSARKSPQRIGDGLRHCLTEKTSSPIYGIQYHRPSFLPACLAYFQFDRYYNVVDKSMLGWDRVVGNFLEQAVPFLTLFMINVALATLGVTSGSRVRSAGWIYVAFRALYPVRDGHVGQMWSTAAFVKDRTWGS